MPHRRSRVRLALACAALLALPVGAGAVGSAQAAPEVFAGPTPRAKCGPGSLPETGMQGRVPPAELESGRAAKGYTCNLTEVGHFASRAGWKVDRYGDCAYYNSEPGGLPLSAFTNQNPGTHVLDVTDPTKPVQTDYLRTPAMQSPHETMAIHAGRGLLVAVLSTLATAPGVLEVWDVKADCKHPTLLSSLPSALLGHEGNFSADGLTFYTGSLYAQTLTAVDLTNPLAPTLIAVENVQSHGMSTNPDGTRLYDTVRGDDTAGLLIYDTSEIQARKAGAQFTLISRLTWPEKSTPQFALHVTIKGKPYVIETDEFGGTPPTQGGPIGTIGAARIIDISNEQVPKVVSNLRLEVHMPANQARFADEGDPKPFLGGPYTGHYCSVPSPVDPGIVACSMLRSGVRVFDIRDPLKPRELAYFNKPGPVGLDGSTGNGGFGAGADVEFVPERGEMWLTSEESGFHVVRFAKGVWPFRRAGPPRGAASLAPAPEPAGPRPLPATGLPEGLAVGGALAFALAVTAAATRADRRRT